ncbi:tRNA pseudouridine(55) synthase TruB [Thermosipho ferrireducens]|uniref:tRNA pseudouridine synthase B n=1 Tax=Thermosipho ferrireducens TaxID=2571116 RepID=A0ABX7S7L8_9BACT|nr:tRNA pseudouridine(55) synthase TruB [Thermosipho ferrireducens]QTA38593.1 tRNA pseudouridine(55) synthase TruB [Thermosipho ferrireducens]
MRGILNVYKPKGVTSHDVVDEIRRKLSIKRVGHAGTLDPFAEGVLIIGVGDATRILEYLKVLEKKYYVKAILGVITETFDITGEVVENKNCDITSQELKDAILSFKGKYLQVPPAYSAKKYKGKKLYQFARQGNIISLPPKEVEIFDISNIKIELPYFSFKVTTSPGTYIRSLCMDIGYKVGCGATSVELVRLAVGEYEIQNSINPYENDSQRIKKALIPIEEAITLPKVEVYGEYVENIFNGVQPRLEFIKEIISPFRKGEDVAIYWQGKIIAIATAERNSKFFKTLYNQERFGERVFTLKKVFKNL